MLVAEQVFDASFKLFWGLTYLITYITDLQRVLRKSLIRQFFLHFILTRMQFIILFTKFWGYTQKIFRSKAFFLRKLVLNTTLIIIFEFNLSQQLHPQSAVQKRMSTVQQTIPKICTVCLQSISDKLSCFTDEIFSP